MVRGAAKAASQERNAKKQAAMKKSGTQLGCGEKAMSTECSICKARSRVDLLDERRGEEEVAT